MGASEHVCKLIARDAHVVDAEFLCVHATKVADLREKLRDAVGGVVLRSAPLTRDFALVGAESIRTPLSLSASGATVGTCLIC